MKVKDLIEKLQSYDKNLEVTFICDETNTEYGFTSVNNLKMEIHHNLDNEPVDLNIFIDD